MPFRKPQAAVITAVALAACGPGAPAPVDKAEARSAESAYLAPPTILLVQLAAGAVVLTGRAPGAARVRLATPAGEAVFAKVDAEGRWTLSLAGGEGPRIFGLSADALGRNIQAQGYLLVTPSGRAALLRSGAGAQRLDPQPEAAIGAFDYDREGGAVVSGAAPAGHAVMVRIDGRQAAEGRADATGRFSIALPSPVAPGPHALSVAGEGFTVEAAVEVSPAAPLVTGPFRATEAPGAVRADWMTPGGGVQSTLLLG